MIIPITDGDIMHIYGGFGTGIDYSVRLSLRLIDTVNGEMLKEAVQNTQKRYPYLLLRLKKDEENLYYEENPEPVTVHNTDGKITLASSESNYHLWAVCYKGDRLYLDISHGLCDGTGMYMVLSTLLYYYCEERYGVTDHTGVRTLEDPILPEESVDPMIYLPDFDISPLPPTTLKPAFSLIEDAGLTPCDPIVYDIIIPEKYFIPFSSANDASPGTMISILFSRTIDELYPEREKSLVNSYIINGRPMLGAPQSHHNCVNTVAFEYSDKVKAMPLEKQCTVHRGATFIQSDADRVKSVMTVSVNRSRMVKKAAPTVEAKKNAYAQMLYGGKRFFTYMVSYVGQWKLKSLSPYVTEFWTHVPNANNLLTEIAAINGNIYLSVHQNFREDDIICKFTEILTRYKIPYEMKQPMANDNAAIKEP